ncbi:retrovirus-related pol polyprotein from transposon TNT 1-94 [Tanacetum coccineum]|uniref:Retrovirus-related pol polyprotein from transposon TNT 1-94 n=1 Tax=Tanacetum coccineum TaxID=301880 RepID=A0ABQ5GKI9_9ASTR
MSIQNVVNHSETEITSDSNIIPHSEYVIESQQEAIQNYNSSAQQDTLILSVIEQLKTQVVNCTKINLDNKSVNETLTDELERYKEQVKVLKEGQNVDLRSNDTVSDSSAQSVEIDRLKQTLSEHLKEKEILMKTVTILKNDFKKEESRNINREIALEKKIKQLDNIVFKRDQSAQTVYMLTKSQFFYDHTTKLALGFQNSFYLKNAQQLEPKLYDGNVIKNTSAIVIPDSEETLMLAEEGPFWSQNSVNSPEPTLSSRPTKVEVPKELPKVSMHTQEEATVLRDLLEHVKSKYPLDHSLESACRYAKLIQESHTHISKTCPSVNNTDGKLVAVTPKNKDKRVRFTEPVTSSRNIITKTASTSNLVSNKPMLSSIGVKPSTSASGSQPSGNTKKDKNRQTPSSTQKNKVEAHPRKVKSSLKDKDCVVSPKGTAHVQHSKLNAISKLNCVKCDGCMLSDNHDLCVLDFINNVNARTNSKSVKKNSKGKVWKPTKKVFTNIGYTWRPTSRTFTIVGNVCPLTRITTTTEVPLRKPTALENETPKLVVILVYLRKPRKSKTNIPVSKSKVLKSVSANKKEPDRCMDKTKIMRKPSKTGKHGHGKRKSTKEAGKSSQTRHSLVRGLPELKFENDHLCSAFAMGKSKKKPHKPKSEDTNQEKLYHLHMDLCRPMRVASVNGKKYIIVIVDDYPRFIWVKFLGLKDEAPDFIIKFLKMIQVRLQVTVRRIRTDNGTEFVNQTLREYYKKIGISYETFVTRSPQQNGVIERRNCTLIEAACTMLIYAKAPLFLWAEVVATACILVHSAIRLMIVRIGRFITDIILVDFDGELDCDGLLNKAI